ncbi:hypothetical protein [Kribbella sp. NBC_00359]|uniref:hypothetical protein n=1 Tax=Kribbella sp. NBC_00359 TaxID=2975966 RepID=UPI002E1DCBEE
MEAVVGDSAAVEDAARQQQYSGNQERKGERANNTVVQIGQAPFQGDPKAVLHDSHEEQQNHKPQEAPACSQSAFSSIPDNVSFRVATTPNAHPVHLLL